MNTKLLTTCLLAGALLLPMAGYTADSGQTDPYYIEPWLMVGSTTDHGQTDPGYIEPWLMPGIRADHGQMDPGFITS